MAIEKADSNAVGAGRNHRRGSSVGGGGGRRRGFVGRSLDRVFGRRRVVPHDDEPLVRFQCTKPNGGDALQTDAGSCLKCQRLASAVADLQSEDLAEAQAAHDAAAADARELHCANAALGGKVCTH